MASPPPGAPTAPSTHTITFASPESSIVITVLPWPIGVEIPADISFKPTPQPAITVPPGRTTTWGTRSVFVAGDENSILIDGSTILLGSSKIEKPPPTSKPPAPPSVTPKDGAESQPILTSDASASGSSQVSQTANASQTSPATSRSSSGLSSGAVAGVAIGCLVAGALIAGLILWFCWRKKRNSTLHDHEASKIALMPKEKGFSSNAISLGIESSTGSPLSGGLPLPLEDKAITGEISKISNSIKNHVQSYYHTGRVSPGLMDFDDVQALGENLPVDIGTISTVLDNSTTREIGLRFCIAWAICSRMMPSQNTSASLLPPEVADCSRKITNTPPTSNSHTTSVAKWRVSTAELMQSTYVRDPFNASDSRNASIQAVVRALENILRPYADSRIDNEQRKRNLEEIIKRSALFAFTLFSQPSTWGFDWQEHHGVKTGELCIFPALVQLTDETGKSLSSPRPFSQPVVRELNG